MARLGLFISTSVLLIWTLGGWDREFVRRGSAFDLASFAFWRGIAGVVQSDWFAIWLPLAYVDQFYVEQSFGFNRMTRGMWLMDLLKIPCSRRFWAFLCCMRYWRSCASFLTRWFWAWALFLGFNVLMLWLYPTLIAPLFNKFTPLPDGELKTRLEALLQRCGFSSNGMFVMDGSRPGHGNAYFTGFGRNKRIVFLDTLLAQLTEPQNRGGSGA